MNITVNENRLIELDGVAGTQNENNVEILNFTFPKKYKDFTKMIVFTIEGKEEWDLIENNQYTLNKSITKYKTVEFYIWFTKAPDKDFRSKAQTLIFNNNKDASDQITTEEINGVQTVINILESEITKVENLTVNLQTLISTIETKLENGEFNGKDGKDGLPGKDGKDALINGINTLNIEAGTNIRLEQIGTTLIINSIGGSGTDKTKLSQFENDTEFITKEVYDLLYYYNKEEVENLLKNVSVDLTGYAKEEWVNTKLTNYLTSSQILELVNNALANYYNKTETDNKLSEKVDKETGKSLVEDTEIARLKTLENYDDTELINELANKVNKSTIINTIDSNTLLLDNNQDARLGELSTLILNMPSELDDRYESLFSFRSGATPTTLTYSATPIKWQGDDCNASGEFIPEANTSYEISIRKVNDTDIVARVGGY